MFRALPFGMGGSTLLLSWLRRDMADSPRLLQRLSQHSAVSLSAPTCPAVHSRFSDTADSLRDFFYHVSQNRAMGGVNMVLEAYHYISSHFPYWDRRSGRDHIWLFVHDEGSCWAPAAIKQSIFLTHWV
ncbi:hypothetical protein ABPG75_009270 [Micractinium tetrahymenae]